MKTRTQIIIALTLLVGAFYIAATVGHPIVLPDPNSYRTD